MGNIDPRFTGEIFRQDHPIILACDRHLASLLPVRMRYKSGGYAAGEVVSRNTTDGLYDSYLDGAASGLGAANAILQDKVDFGTATSGSQIAVGIFGGKVYSAKLTGMDAAGIVDLKGRTVIDATGVSILMF